MAAHTISTNRGEYAPDGSYAEEAEQGGAQPKRLLYSYFTAGKHCWLCLESSLCVRQETCDAAIQSLLSGAAAS